MFNKIYSDNKQSKQSKQSKQAYTTTSGNQYTGYTGYFMSYQKSFVVQNKASIHNLHNGGGMILS